MNLFGDNFRTAGDRDLKFCRVVRACCEQLLAKFQVAATNSLEVMAVLCFEKFDFVLRMRTISGPWGSPEMILVLKFEF